MARLGKTHTSSPNLIEDDIERLEWHVTDEEIKRALFDMKPWKALGPNEFPAGFIKNPGT